MNLLEIIQRAANPEPWAEGEKIPWNDPAFSARMLKEHLSQAHDAASRRSSIIDDQVRWIHTHLLKGQPSRVLDLGCGPGLYTMRLAALGHTCTGLDFSPASIAYARQQADDQHLNCTYEQIDLREATFDSGYDLVMLIFGEFNVFKPADARRIIEKAYAALNPGGVLLLEPHPYAAIHDIGQRPTLWYGSNGGLFAEEPHIVLHEHLWHEVLQATIERYFIIVVDDDELQVTRHASSMQAYTDDEYRSLLRESGFNDIQFYSSLGGAISLQKDLIVISAIKPAS